MWLLQTGLNAPEEIAFIFEVLLWSDRDRWVLVSEVLLRNDRDSEVLLRNDRSRWVLVSEVLLQNDTDRWALVSARDVLTLCPTWTRSFTIPCCSHSSQPTGHVPY